MIGLKYVFACAEFWGGLFALTASVYLFVARTAIKKQFRALAELELVVGLMLAFDSIAWIFRGTPGKFFYYILYGSNFLSFVCNAIIPLCFTAYIILSIDEAHRSVKIMYTLGTVAAIAEVFLIGTQMSGYIFSIDPTTNLYQREDGFICWTLLVGVEVIIAYAYVFVKRKYISGKRFKVAMLFIILPAIAMVVQLFVYGYSLSNMACLLAVFVMFGQVLEDNIQTILEQQAHIMEKTKELQDMQTRIAISQIRPEFITDALSSVKKLCDTDTTKAKEAIESLSDYLRTNISSIESNDLAPFTRELEHTNAFLAIEKFKYGDTFDVEYDIECDDFEMPALTLQPMVENAVHHGIFKKKSGEKGRIEIITREGNGYYKIEIIDNGIGFDVVEAGKNENDKQIGVKNVKARLEMMENAEMRVKSEIGKGTTVEIIIPKNRRE